MHLSEAEGWHLLPRKFNLSLDNLSFRQSNSVVLSNSSLNVKLGYIHRIFISYMKSEP
jgi:hypothetical protein